MRTPAALFVCASALVLVASTPACSSDGDDDGAANGPSVPGGPQGGPPVGSNGTCPQDVSKEPGTVASGLTIPSGHPRLWWTPERIARAKAWLGAHPFDPRDDDYYGQIFLHVVSGADCSSAIAWAMDFTVPDSEFNVASDDVRWSGEQAILVYDWCFDQLSGDQRATLLDRWNGYIGKAKDLDWGGPEMPENNYYWGYLRNEIEWGIATQGESPTATGFLDHGLVTRWKESFLPFAQGAGLGGVAQEGTQYGAYMTDYPINPFVTATLLGRSLYDETDFWKGTALYVLYATTPAQTVTGRKDERHGFEVFPFNDDESFQDGSSAGRFANFMAQAAGTWDCLPIGKLARGWGAMVGAEPTPYIASVDRGGESMDPTGLPLDYYAPGPRYFYGRSAWGPDATTFHWQLGDYETAGVGHMHYDFGTFQIWRKGRWLTRESTGYGDTYTGLGGSGTIGSGDAPAHNTIMVDGTGFASPSDHGVDGPPVVRRLESQAGYAYADVDLTKAYRNTDNNGHPDRDNPAVAHVERELVFLRGLETTVILDRVESRATGGKSAEAIDKTFLAHFEKSPVVEDPNHVSYTTGDQALRMTILLPAAPKTGVVDEQEADGSSNGQFRLEVSTSGDAQSYFLTVLQGKDASAPALSPSLADDGTNLTVTLDGSTSVVFVKGETSSGGSVTIGGAKKELRGDVQGIKVTDAGPAWL
jgi:hypothetical protein